MKDQRHHLDQLLSQAIDLLDDCDWPDKAAWFRDVQSALRCSLPNSNEFRALLAKLDKSLVGMGSFSDLPLRSTSGRMTEAEVTNAQFKLVAELGEAIDDFW